MYSQEKQKRNMTK